MTIRIGSVGLVSLLAGIAFAQAPRAPVPFTPVKGLQEFTGRMIVKPKFESAYYSRGLGITEAANERFRAVLALQNNAISREDGTDEFIVRVPRGTNENRYAQSLMATGRYEYVAPDWRVMPIKTADDPSFTRQWHHATIGSEKAWDTVTGSTTLRIAVCDTGVDTAHPDLRANMIPGFNSATNRSQAQGGDVTDIHGHGTHVAGCAAAVGNNKVGVSGVIWNVRMMPIRVTNSTNGSASLSDITRGIRWAADNGARIISVSFSGASNSTVETTGAYVRSKGGILLWAAGNDNANLSSFDHPNVVVVGATDQKDAKASFSAFGRGVDVFAPGVGILSTVRNNQYQAWSGTSMATPVAAGALALIWAANPQLTAAKAEEALFRGAKDLGTPGNDDYWGWGRIDVAASVAIARGSTSR